MKEEDDFSKYEDDLIILLNKLSTTIDTFNTLSRGQAEKAILETNIKINNCKETIDKMEKYVKEHQYGEEIDKNELNKKILNYKTEYHEILNKYNEIQKNYINKKAENALIEEDNEKDLVDDDETKNKEKIKNKSEGYIVDGELIDKNKKNNNDKRKANEVNKKNEIGLINENNNKNTNIQHNNSQVLNYNLNPKINEEIDEPFNKINKDNDIKKKRTICICVAFCIFIFLITLISTILSIKK